MVSLQYRPTFYQTKNQSRFDNSTILWEITWIIKMLQRIVPQMFLIKIYLILVINYVCVGKLKTRLLVIHLQWNIHTDARLHVDHSVSNIFENLSFDSKWLKSEWRKRKKLSIKFLNHLRYKSMTYLSINHRHVL